VSVKLARAILLAALTIFYVTLATEHAEKVNNFKARGDQSGYLGDAENVYANWHGKHAAVLIGERNRMPLYAGYLALFYSPSMSDDEFFVVAKRWNIYLSVVLLALLGFIFTAFLPALPAANLLLVVAFGYFVFKAGYAQSELLFYFLFFVAFVLFFELLRNRFAPRAGTAIAVAAGVFAALAHLTKAALLPLLLIFLGACCVDLLRPGRARPVTSFVVPIATMLSFLIVLSPYLRTNKLVFGQYFYNVNTTFYMWYDDWPQASVGTIKHGDALGWPDLPAEQLPSASKYWREHTVNQIARRIAGGFRDMIDRSYQTYWYFKYVLLYLAAAIAVGLRRSPTLFDQIRRHRALAIFLGIYALTYLLGIAFYAPVSGTGTTRFLIAHLTPLLFVLSVWLASPTMSDTTWNIGRVTLETAHFHLFVFAMMMFDVVFLIWPRVMTTYGGF